MVLTAGALTLSTAHATDFCVADRTALVSALGTVGGNGQNDTIMLEQGTYLTPGLQFYMSSTEGMDLTIIGGYTPGCGSREGDPRNTTLDGQNLNRVMNLNSTGGTLIIEGLSFINGSLTYGLGSGLLAGGQSGGSTTDIIVRNCVIRDNNGADYGSLYATSDLGSVHLINNLVSDNSSDAYGGGLILCNGTEIVLTNNTVTGNTVGNGYIGGLEAYGGVAVLYVSNNIFYGNGGIYDFKGNPTGPYHSSHNDIGSETGDPPDTSVGDVNVDPVFEGNGSYRLSFLSTLIDSGDNAPYGGLPNFDLDYQQRVVDGTVDIGAYESDILFSDGFESGDTSIWSTSIP
jgi:hypothetical protein